MSERGSSDLRISAMAACWNPSLATNRCRNRVFIGCRETWKVERREGGEVTEALMSPVKLSLVHSSQDAGSTPELETG